MMLFVVLAVTLGLVAPSPIKENPDPADDLDNVDPSMLQLPPERTLGGDSLSQMFQEVEQLIKDTQLTLANAAKELAAEEISEDKAALKDLPPNYHNESITETKVGNATIITKQEITKETNNQTGSTYISEQIVSSVKNGDKAGHECIVDEDCRPGNYCHLSSVNYRCLPCKEEQTCTRDGECCEGRLCVWGQCTTSSKGKSGTICESQQDCGPGLCCAVHTSLLFPVCTPLPGKGEQCQIPNPLLELFTWELEAEVPVNLCPCPTGLVCQPQSHSLMSVCEDPALLNPKRDDPGATEDDPSLVTPGPQDEIVYEDAFIVPTDLGFDLGASEDVMESELVRQPQVMDYI